MITIHGIEMEFSSERDGINNAAALYPQYIRQGGRATFHGFLIEVIKLITVHKIEHPKPRDRKELPHYSEILSMFIKDIGMARWQEMVDRYSKFQPKKNNSENSKGEKP